MRVFRKNEDQVENRCEDLEVDESAIDKEALFAEAEKKLNADVEYWDSKTHVLTDDNLNPKAIGFVKDGFATGEGAVLQVPETKVDEKYLLNIYADIVGMPIGHEIRVSKHLPNPMKICENLKTKLEDLMGEEPEVAYTQHATKQTSFNIKCVEGYERYFAMIGVPEIHNAVPKDYVNMIRTCADVFDELTNLPIETDGDHNLCSEALENYPMIMGSLPYKTRETGRKDGTGEIDRCF